MASCGVILGRATFYGAEGPRSVVVCVNSIAQLFLLTGLQEFLKGLFPSPTALPNIVWYDNNCRVVAHLQSEADDYFQNVAFPVDVFHFKTKHKATDEFCGRHCNPALWLHLMEDGKWVFNSSAAEQANARIGGFRSMTRLMLHEW